MKKYFATKSEAKKALDERIKKGYSDLHIFRMKKGTRKAGMFAVCTEIEYLNTY